MNILLLGSGGREHALALGITQSSRCTKLFIAPGNPGMSSLGICVSEVSPNDFPAIEALVLREEINLVVVGTEEPLVNGIVDYFRSSENLHDVLIVGPDARGAKLEGSKDFSKAFMQRHGIPTADYQSFRQDELKEALAFLQRLSPPYVLKADGLAAGKGVVIVDTLSDAERELSEMLAGRFGKASSCVVIEKFLKGIECSVFVVTDGKDYRILPVAKDYKRIGEGDKGLNTGGMGSVSPVPFADEVFMNKVEERIVKPTVQGILSEGIDYRGFIFIGLINVEGEPYVIEYNCRMGDPETQSVVMRVESDLVELLERTAKGEIGDYILQESKQVIASVVLVSKGYPEDYHKGFEITLPKKLEPNTYLFHAGTTLNEQGILSTNGGRVMAVSCYGNTILEALEACYKQIETIHYEGKTYRRDIGRDLID